MNFKNNISVQRIFPAFIILMNAIDQFLQLISKIPQIRAIAAREQLIINRMVLNQNFRRKPVVYHGIATDSALVWVCPGHRSALERNVGVRPFLIAENRNATTRFFDLNVSQEGLL